MFFFSFKRVCNPFHVRVASKSMGSQLIAKRSPPPNGPGLSWYLNRPNPGTPYFNASHLASICTNSRVFIPDMSRAGWADLWVPGIRDGFNYHSVGTRIQDKEDISQTRLGPDSLRVLYSAHKYLLYP
ncbi:hypothetical protein RRG08_046793 [Elysia crispata]|uniref:Uncharacterized protein n=1 Tax=Elysia crispata TaxID=231223 RepID=A0AAE0ZWD7_9GAST|nr:hypothetical protein RRG08_046793 [Elysia crispata]